MKFKNPKHELPDKQCEVIVKGYSDWIGGNYHISLWNGHSFLGCGGYPEEDYFPVIGWCYITED